jgi:DNA polymerase I-like protein with 3'-5' exonuclease and polymerase domains
MKEKTQNYTQEQTLAMVAEYLKGTPTDAIAESMGKSMRSIVAKLSREGVYVAKQYVTKTGQQVQKKDQQADQIAVILQLTEAETESLTKANKSVLTKILLAVSCPN